MEKEIELLEAIWSAVAEWQGMYAGWKDGKFRQLQVGGAVVSWVLVWHGADC